MDTERKPDIFWAWTAGVTGLSLHENVRSDPHERFWQLSRDTRWCERWSVNVNARASGSSMAEVWN